VERANHPRLGLILDSFHTLVRSDDWSALRDLPGNRIFFVQVGDAPRMNVDPLTLRRHHSRLPGDGDFDLAAAMAGADGLIQCTPTGMGKRPGLPLKAALLQSRHWIAEIVYFPPETELLRVARAKGCRTLDGSGMAVFQAVGAFRLFTGLDADAARMDAQFWQLVAK